MCISFFSAGFYNIDLWVMMNIFDNEAVHQLLSRGLNIMVKTGLLDSIIIWLVGKMKKASNWKGTAHEANPSPVMTPKLRRKMRTQKKRKTMR